MRKSIIGKRKSKQEQAQFFGRLYQFQKFLDGYEQATLKNMYKVKTDAQSKFEEGSNQAIGVIKDEFTRLFFNENYECISIQKK